MECIKITKSKLDNTIKYIFTSNNNIIELSYINKNDGKNIVVVPTQTSCNLGCKFCFLTGLKIPVRNLTPLEIVMGITRVLNDIENKNDVLLISFMGCGEPLLAINEIISTMKIIRDLYSDYYNIVRFAVASLIPNQMLFNIFLNKIFYNKLKCKFHYSLHTTDVVLRKVLMPAALPLEIPEKDYTTLRLIRDYMEITENSAEIHYSLMNGINDKQDDLKALIELLCIDNGKSIPIKLLKLSEKPDKNLTGSKQIIEFQNLLQDAGIETEYYEPPGSDVGSSCGQFLLDYYEKYGEKND